MTIFSTSACTMQAEIERGMANQDCLSLQLSELVARHSRSVSDFVQFTSTQSDLPFYAAHRVHQGTMAHERSSGVTYLMITPRL